MDARLRKEFQRICREKGWEGSEKKHLEEVFNEGPGLDQVPQNLLLSCLSFPLRWIQVNALYEIFARSAGDLAQRPPAPRDRVALLGELDWSHEEFAALLQPLGLEVVSPESQPAYIFLGPNVPEKALDDAVSAVFLPPDHLLPQLLTQDRFFLQQPNRSDEVGNIRQMILSQDIESAKLGLNLMYEAGLPEGFETEAFAIWRSRRPYSLRVEAEKLLFRYTTGHFKKNMLRNFFSFNFDDGKLIRANQQDYDPDQVLEVSRYLKLNFLLSPLLPVNAEVLVEYHGGLAGLDASLALEITEIMVQNGRLRLPRATKAVPSEVYQIRDLRSLELLNDRLETMPAGISELESLLRFQVDGCLSSLPEDLAECTALRWLWFRDNRFPEFPREILKLPRLRYLSWIRGLKDSDQTLEIPEAIASVPLNSLHLEEKEVAFPESFFQHPTLQSLNISQSALLPYQGRISELPQLKRLQVSLEEGENANEELKTALSDWRLEDQKYTSLSFVRS